MKQAALAPLFAVPFAAQAQTNTITQIPQTSTAIGRASMALGFPASCMTPLAAGGSPPYGQDLNGILNMLSTAAQAAELGMMRPFSASYAAAVGGYPAGATVAHPTITGRYLLCTQDGNENDPSQSMTGWLDPMTAFQPAGNYQPAGDYATHTDLSAERQRAETAEAGLLPLSGGTVTGNILKPNGNILAESSASNGPTLIQRFSASGTQGGWIPFPQQFSSDNVQVVAFPLDYGDHVFRIANWFSINRYGFSLSLNGYSGAGYAGTPGATVQIIAMGAP